VSTARLGGVVLSGLSLVAIAACNETGAKVVSAEPITHVVKTPREECSDQQVQRPKPVKDEKQILGTATGAVVGAVVGHQFGSGKGKDLATVGGAVAGGYAGNRIQNNIQEKSTETVTERVCKTVYDSRTEETGRYRVRYELDGKQGTVTMDHHPGDTIRVQEGRLVL